MSLIFGSVSQRSRGVSVRAIYRNGAWIGDAVRWGHYWLAMLPDRNATVIRGEDGRAARWTLREGPLAALAMAHEGIRLL